MRMVKKVLVIDPGKILYKSNQYGLGILIVYERLLQLSVDVKLFNTAKDSLSERDSIVDEIIDFNPCAVCMTTRSDTYPFCLDLAHRIKEKHKDIKIIFGGPQATLTHNLTLEFTKNVDVIVRGAGEGIVEQVILSDFCYHSLEAIPNISYNDLTRGKIVVTETSDNNIEPLTPVDSLICYNITPQTKRIDIEAGRGCSFSCSFCVTNKVWNKNYSLREPKGLVRDVVSLTRGNEMIEEVNFTHDNLLINKINAEKFIDVIYHMMPERLSWSCSARIDLLNEDVIKKLKSARCNGIYLGIETGSEKMQKIYNKNINLNEALNNLMLLNNNQIKFIVSLIIGHPLETREDVFDTLLLAVFAKNLNYCKTVQIHKLAIVYGADFFEEYADDLVFDSNSISDQSTNLIDENDTKLILRDRKLFSSFYSLYREKYIRNFGFKAKLFQLIINSCHATLKLMKTHLGLEVFKSILMDRIQNIEDFKKVAESYIGCISILYDSFARYELNVLEMCKLDYNALHREADRINSTYRIINSEIDLSTQKSVKTQYIMWLQSDNNVNACRLDESKTNVLNAVLSNQLTKAIRESDDFVEWTKTDLIW